MEILRAMLPRPEARVHGIRHGCRVYLPTSEQPDAVNPRPFQMVGEMDERCLPNILRSVDAPKISSAIEAANPPTRMVLILRHSDVPDWPLSAQGNADQGPLLSSVKISSCLTPDL